MKTTTCISLLLFFTGIFIPDTQAQLCKFDDPISYFVPDPPVGANPRFINSGDLDGDGDIDIVTDSNGPGTDPTQVFWNDGMGNFMLGPVLTAGWGSGEVALGDMDGDGDLDVIRCCINSIGVYFFRNNGDGTFESGIFYATGGGYTSVEFVDFDNDGDLDFVAGGSQIRPYRNINGLGFTSVGLFYCGGPSYGLDVGDIDGDGDQDIIVANDESNTVTVVFNAGDGTYPTHQQFTVSEGPLEVILEDLNRDGNLDAVVSNWGRLGDYGDTVSVLIGDGSGNFAPQQVYTTGLAPRSVRAADFNDDGMIDLIVSCQFGNLISLLPGNENGTFAQAQIFDQDYSPHGATLADFDGDGDTDIAYVDRASSRMITMRNSCVIDKGNDCLPDLTGDGNLDFFDVSAFLNAFNASDPNADFTGDGTFDFFDVSVFLNAYNAGCP